MSANCDFTISELFAGFNLWAKKESVMKIPTVNPGIGLKCYDNLPLRKGIEDDVFLKDPKSRSGYFVGNSWSHDVVFVDHTHPNSSEYWGSMLHYLQTKMSYSGV
jgi:alpha-glucosidase (family GH31 glycosyl hydrolase)